MKRIILFLAVCLGLSVSQTTFADVSDTVRAASKRTNSVTTADTQQNSRSVTTSSKRQSNQSKPQQTSRTSAQTQQKTVSRNSAQKQQNVTARPTPKTQPSKTNTTRISTTSRTASTRNVSSRNNANKKTYVKPSLTKTVSSDKKVSRNALLTKGLDAEKISNIKSLDYSKCKTVYYECMDEFCANKDTNLRRCACSSRIHEFDGIKKQLSNAEDKMLDFNQRLLTVSLDKEDAAKINVATEGELAFEKKDYTESEKLLQKITNSLNNSGDSRLNNNLASISLSLDVDSAWDNIDSLSGIATSSKNGLDLYNAARPICIEMAKEICGDDELNIAENGYKLTIQQDCDTVAKAYKTQYSNAMEKIHESGALLDMSRLNVYQQRNSDDTLTCRKKILEQLSGNSVCGTKLYKCLDTTGQYINPSDGSAVLSENLYKLKDLLTEPKADEKWSTQKQNESFVKFLNSKKEFLKPAVEQCTDISDMIWKDFLDDALAQIKLAQNAKIEEIKQSCTKLIADCKTATLNDLSDFDARALSSFSVAADKTVNTMCSDITKSCTKIMNISDISGNWKEGIDNILHDQTLQTVMEECMNIGRNCIIQQCNATAGNFALCQDETSEIRISILKHEACYTKVSECVANADGMTESDGSLTDEGVTVLANIWGACTDNSSTGTIKSDSSLLSWFATNSGSYSCNVTGCETGYTMINGVCEKVLGQQTSDGGSAQSARNIVNVTDNFTNYCKSGIRDAYKNCCVTPDQRSNGICTPNDWIAVPLMDLQCPANSSNNYICPKSGYMTLYCVTPVLQQDGYSYITYDKRFAKYTCNGENAIWVVVDENGNYIKVNTDYPRTKPKMYYQNSNNELCEYTYSNDNGWFFSGDCSQTITTPPTDNEFLIKYILN